MKEEIRTYIIDLLYDIASTDSQIVLLAILLVAIVIVLDAVSKFAKKERQRTGIDSKTSSIENYEKSSIPVKRYVSDMQQLSGTPDAIISENGYIIPIERKPLAKKIRDRYVAQLLVYMRLIEEFEGKKPPYGYLVLGPNCRRVKIYNSEARQRWLQKYIDEMLAILEETAESIPQPHYRKCRKCNVRNNCSSRIEYNRKNSKPADPIPFINSKEKKNAGNDQPNR